MVDWRLLPDAIAWRWQADCDTACTEDSCEVTWRDARFSQPTVEEFEAVLEDYVTATSAEKKPKWAQFQSSMLINGAYLRIVGTSPMTLTLNSALIWMLGEVGQHPDRLADVMNTWNAIAFTAQVKPLEAAALQKICVGCNMPFYLDEHGFMILAQIY